jgi:uncharacterized protein YcfJ
MNESVTVEELLQLISVKRNEDGLLFVVNVNGEVLGDVNGSVLGDVRGNVWGNVGGSVLGDVRFNVWGDVNGRVGGSVLNNNLTTDRVHERLASLHNKGGE